MANAGEIMAAMVCFAEILDGQRRTSIYPKHIVYKPREVSNGK